MSARESRIGKGAVGVARRDDGNVTILSLGLTVLVISLVLVVASATAVQLDRVRLLHLADELALDAADALDLDAYYAGEIPGDDATVMLAEDRMMEAAAGHLAEASGRQGVEGARIAAVTSPDGSTAVVSVRLRVDPLFGVSALLPFSHGITLSAESSARAS
ncbi:pilus assembly protein TadG-related protein [Demequina salsinemoris]|uniref:pilus assembly protein TadG-related protein n=1 Tax=Demequina salsinemoris TaxID=577470 RepID=UPI0007816ACC|nr:pilus assembly protein TadG-related protein [Demequina salsinemoris]